MRKLDKSCSLPSLYQAYVSGWDPKTNTKKKLLMSFLLPHEILNHFVQPESHSDWSDLGDSRPGLQRTLLEWGDRLGLPVVQD
eukprot:9305292-Pyramimonas_sp.AAC.1